MINGGKENRIVVSNERTADEITWEKIVTVYQEAKPNNKSTSGFYAIFMHTSANKADKKRMPNIHMRERRE